MNVHTILMSIPSFNIILLNIDNVLKIAKPLEKNFSKCVLSDIYCNGWYLQKFFKQILWSNNFGKCFYPPFRNVHAY